MSASLVGSEMCIRDRPKPETTKRWARMAVRPRAWATRRCGPPRQGQGRRCLLYTSDAADDM
eukprot:11290896-Alexandrium_andersonii.AAC.1